MSRSTRERDMWTEREAEIIDEHQADFHKDNDRYADRGELLDIMRERMDEEDASPLAAEFEAIVDKLIISRDARTADGRRACHCGAPLGTCGHPMRRLG